MKQRPVTLRAKTYDEFYMYFPSFVQSSKKKSQRLECSDSKVSTHIAVILEGTIEIVCSNFCLM